MKNLARGLFLTVFFAGLLAWSLPEISKKSAAEKDETRYGKYIIAEDKVGLVQYLLLVHGLVRFLFLAYKCALHLFNLGYKIFFLDCKYKNDINLILISFYIGI